MMKRILVAMVAVMFLLGFNAVSFADEKAGGDKGKMAGEMKGDKKDEKKKDEKEKEKGKK
ncbi:MAG: hypothetical protein ACREI2_16040 [Nitrospiraceae bacterium]